MRRWISPAGSLRIGLLGCLCPHTSGPRSSLFDRIRVVVGQKNTSCDGVLHRMWESNWELGEARRKELVRAQLHGDRCPHERGSERWGYVVFAAHGPQAKQSKRKTKQRRHSIRPLKQTRTVQFSSSCKMPGCQFIFTAHTAHTAHTPHTPHYPSNSRKPAHPGGALYLCCSSTASSRRLGPSHPCVSSSVVSKPRRAEAHSPAR